MKSFCIRPCLLLLVVVGINLFSAAQSASTKKNAPTATSATLFCGTDESGFGGTNGQLAVVKTSGAQVVAAAQLFNLDVPVNGISFNSPYLWAGQPETVGSVLGNTLRHISVSLPPTVTATVPPGANSFSASCCNEQMVEFKGSLLHAHYGTGIQRVTIDASGNSEVTQTYAQTDVVGMATDGARVWISLWSGGQVGTWDPASNVFTKVFSTPSNPGGLAWDVANHVLWVGMLGGSVIPYSATGKQLGTGFQPFGSIGDTVDGLALVPAGGAEE